MASRVSSKSLFSGAVAIAILGSSAAHAQDQAPRPTQGATTNQSAADQPADDLDAIIDRATGPSASLAVARGQADGGDLLGAAATLERALFDRSDRSTGDVRAYYIALLCRLDDRTRANAEVTRLGSTPVSDGAWNDVLQRCGPTTRPAAGGGKSSLTGALSVGVAYDSDTLGALAQLFSFPGSPAPTDDGVAVIAGLRVDARTSIGGTGFAYGGIDISSKDSLSGPALDYQIGTFRAGLGTQLGRAQVSLGPVGTYARIADQDFVGEYGGQLGIALPAPGNGLWTLSGEIVHQDYEASSPPFFSRNGERYDAALDYQRRTSAGLIYVLGGAFEYKTADTDYLGYIGGRLYGAARLPLNAKGTYANLSATIRHIAYLTIPFNGRQIETRYFVRGAIGTPTPVRGIDIEAAASYTRRDYNFDYLASYSSAGVELRLVWNFGKQGAER
jgi:hypothetical protein